MDKIIKKEIKLVIFLDDNGETKNKEALIISTNDHGVEMQFWDRKERKVIGGEFFLPWHRILKIKRGFEDDS